MIYRTRSWHISNLIKIIIEVFKNMRVDDIIDANKRKPPIPHENEILEIGVGEFGEKYKKKYNL